MSEELKRYDLVQDYHSGMVIDSSGDYVEWTEELQKAWDFYQKHKESRMRGWSPVGFTNLP